MYRPKIIFSLLTSSKEKEDCHFTKNKVVTFRVILLRDVRHITHGTHQEKTIYCDNIMINVSCTAIACSIILSSVKLEKRCSITERVSSRLLTSPPSLHQRLLNSFLLELKHRNGKRLMIADVMSEQEKDANKHSSRRDYLYRCNH